MQVLPFVAMGAQAYGSYSSGKAADKAGQYNAAILNQRAEAEKRSFELSEYQQLKNLEATIGEQTSGFAGRGFDVTTGSPLDRITDTLSKGYLDVAIQKYNSQITQRGFESQAAQSIYEGKQKQKEQQLKAGLTLLKGASDYNTKYKPFEPKDKSTYGKT